VPPTAFKDVPALMLGPLEGRGDDAWFHAPPGAWCPGQVVDHVAAAIEMSARGFESRTAKSPTRRRPRTLRQRVFQFLVLRTGRFPRGRRAPAGSLPADHPERAATERRLREAVAAFLELEHRLLPQRAADLFLKHPAFGDLTLSEWMTFHVRHAEHHAKQVRARIP
jgi:Protein of unknown function (DUF1569)